jgi:CheY-like chemotaxis protein
LFTRHRLLLLPNGQKVAAVVRNLPQRDYRPFSLSVPAPPHSFVARINSGGPVELEPTCAPGFLNRRPHKRRQISDDLIQSVRLSACRLAEAYSDPRSFWEVVVVARVLVIDDNEDILTLVRGAAERMGLITSTLSNTLQFMTTFVRFKPDIVLLDMMMPHMDGIEIIQWMVDVDYTGRLVVMSGNADFERMGRGLADSDRRMVVTSLPKPFRIAELEAVLRA